MSTDFDSEPSVSGWIQQLQTGDHVAAQRLWVHFSHSVVQLAMKRLAGRKPRIADEDDVVVSVFRTLFRRAEAGDFSRLQDRHDLWRLLVTITDRKVLNLVRDQRRKKRGGGHVVGESACLRAADHSLPGLQNFESKEPTPEFVATMVETVEHLLGLLDEENRGIALARLEGYSNEEIAAQVGRSVATVERRVKLIRTRWASWSEGV